MKRFSAAGKDFAFLREEIALVKKSLADKSISLNEAERRKELAQSKARKEQREQEGRALKAARPTTYEIRLRNTSSPGLPAPMAVAGGNTAHVPPSPPAKADDAEGAGADGSPLDEINLNESVQILADYVRLMKGRASK